MTANSFMHVILTSVKGEYYVANVIQDFMKKKMERSQEPFQLSYHLVWHNVNDL